MLKALNDLQSAYPSLCQWDCDARGFEWLSADDAQHSVISFLRHGDAGPLVVIFNFTPEPRAQYRIPISYDGNFREIYNSDAAEFGGSDLRTGRLLKSESDEYLGRSHSLSIDLPPLAALVLRPDNPGSGSEQP